MSLRYAPLTRPGKRQPANTREVWNFKGYVNNAWHRVRLTLR